MYYIDIAVLSKSILRHIDGIENMHMNPIKSISHPAVCYYYETEAERNKYKRDLLDLIAGDSSEINRKASGSLLI